MLYIIRIHWFDKITVGGLVEREVLVYMINEPIETGLKDYEIEFFLSYPELCSNYVFSAQ
jgi:hypothetical protein